MPINVKNFINSLNLKSKNSDFQDLEHLDGVSISTVCANLYKTARDDFQVHQTQDLLKYRLSLLLLHLRTHCLYQ